jgi:hypothetical protein
LRHIPRRPSELPSRCYNSCAGFRRPFAEWLDEKRSFLQGGLSFKLEDNSADVYSLLSSLLLPSLWNAMGPIE